MPVNVTLATPAEIPVRTPVVDEIEATVPGLQLQVPEGAVAPVESISVIVEPTHTDVGP